MQDFKSEKQAVEYQFQNLLKEDIVLRDFREKNILFSALMCMSEYVVDTGGF